MVLENTYARGQVRTGPSVSVPTDTRGSKVSARDPHVESLRGLACILLVAYHNIGSTAAFGAQLAYPHPLRVLTDLMIDVRMPLFAFIAGYAYACRPPDWSGLPRFFKGKAVRLLVPAVFAVLVLALVKEALGRPLLGSVEDLLWFVYMPRPIFWYLQAILILLTIFAVVDCWLRRRHVWLFLGCAIGLTVFVPTPDDLPFPIKNVLYLSVYFFLAIAIVRYQHWFIRNFLGTLAVFSVCFGAGLVLNVVYLAEAEHFSLHRFDCQSVLTGIGACALLFMTRWRIGVLEIIGTFSYTIYLYHITVRIVMPPSLERLGVEALDVRFAISFAAGVLVPILIHLLASQFGISRRLLLGLKR